MPFIFEDNRIYVPVSWSGCALPWFILDTGVLGILIDTNSAEQLGLEIASSSAGEGAGSGKLDVGTSGSALLTVGKTRLNLENTRIAGLSKVLEPYSGRRIGGIIGGALFREHQITIDILRHRIELHDPGGFQYSGAGQVLNFEFVNGIPIVIGEITLPDESRLSLRLLIDLGAKANLLVSEPFVEKNHLREYFTNSIV